MAKGYLVFSVCVAVLQCNLAPQATWWGDNILAASVAQAYSWDPTMELLRIEYK